MAEKFNNYFTGIAQTLAMAIPRAPNSFKEYMKPSLLNSFALNLTSPEEIINLCKSLHLTHSSGHDDIDPCIVGPNLNYLAFPLSEIINCSFSSGIVPLALKIAKVSPIYKQGNKEDLKNYRPISILPYFSKILEKTMYTRLYHYVTAKNILYPYQHGFRAGHSTSMSLINIQEKITQAIENNEFSIGIFLDLAKAFDTVDHKILLSKLEIYGIRGTPLKWFTSYLSQRQQQVKCNGMLSTLKFIKYGVPQGSILGPLLFLIYINDLPNVSSILHIVLFADDTNAFTSHKSLDTLFQIANHELNKLSNWFKANRLSFNLEKTNYIIFTSHRKSIPTHNQKLLIEDTPITLVRSVKFLGVYIGVRQSVVFDRVSGSMCRIQVLPFYCLGHCLTQICS